MPEKFKNKTTLIGHGCWICVSGSPVTKIHEYRDAMIFGELRFQNSPKSPHIRARLYCDANEKSLPWKGLFWTPFPVCLGNVSLLPFSSTSFPGLFPPLPISKGKALGTSLPLYMGFPPESLLALSSQLRSLWSTSEYFVLYHLFYPYLAWGLGLQL